MKGLSIRQGAIVFTTLMVLATANPAFAKRHSGSNTAKLLKDLCGPNQQAALAVKALQQRKHILNKVERFVARAKCTINTDAVLSLFDAQGPKGCKAIAALLKPGHGAWLDAVILRYRALHTCPALKKAVYQSLGFATPQQAAQVLKFAIQDKDPVPQAFAWLYKGPKNVRLAAIKAIVTGGVQGGYAQLMKLYNQMLMKHAKDVDVRRALLSGMLWLNSQSTIPLLINTLGSKSDGDYACTLLSKVAVPAAKQMNMALKMIRCTAKQACAATPIMKCLSRMGTPVINQVLALFDVHRPYIRHFVVSFLRQWHSRDVLEFLLGRYPGAPAPDRADIVTILGRYTLKDKRIRNIIASAFNDGDKNVRLAALGMVSETNGTGFCSQVQDLAENDSEEQVKAAAVDTIYRLGCPKAVPLLNRLARYVKPLIRVRVLHALGLMMESGDLGFLYKLLDADDQKVADAARNALILLTNQNPAKHHVDSLPTVRPWQLTGRKVKLPNAVAYVKGDGHTLIVVVGGGLDSNGAWVVPGIKKLADDYTVAMMDANAPVVPTEAVVALMDVVKHKRAYVMGNGIWALDAARLQLALPYQLQGAILVNPPYPTSDAIEAVSKHVMDRLSSPFHQALDELMRQSAMIRPRVLNRYYTRLVAPALAPHDKPPWRLWGMPSNTLHYNQAQVTLKKDMDPSALSQVKALVVFSGAFIPKSQQQAFRKVKKLRVKTLKDCGYVVSPFCMGDLVDEIQDFTGD